MLKTRIGLTVAVLLLITPAAGVADTGCGTEIQPVSGTYSFEFDGLNRVYRIELPEDYQPHERDPLIITFHGWGGDESEFLNDAIMLQETSDRGYILAGVRGIGSGEPDQRLNSWSFSGSTTGVDNTGAKICDDEVTNDYSYASCRDKGIARNTCSWTHCQGESLSDVDFVVALIDEIGKKWCIDRDRVFASGSSNGGMFTWELGRNPVSAGVFRAIAPFIGVPHRGTVTGPPEGSAMPVLLITGKQDPTVPPGDWDDPGFTTTADGDRYFYSGATAVIQAWSGAHGCDVSGVAHPFGDGNEAFDCRSYCKSEAGWPAVLDCRADMGHVNGFPSSWSLVLDFFDAHSGESQGR